MWQWCVSACSLRVRVSTLMGRHPQACPRWLSFSRTSGHKCPLLSRTSRSRAKGRRVATRAKPVTIATYRSWKRQKADTPEAATPRPLALPVQSEDMRKLVLVCLCAALLGACTQTPTSTYKRDVTVTNTATSRNGGASSHVHARDTQRWKNVSGGRGSLTKTYTDQQRDVPGVLRNQRRTRTTLTFEELGDPSCRGAFCSGRRWFQFSHHSSGTPKFAPRKADAVRGRISHDGKRWHVWRSP